MNAANKALVLALRELLAAIDKKEAWLNPGAQRKNWTSETIEAARTAARKVLADFIGE